MTDTFDKCLRELLIHEGGFANHPRDPGGVTMLGVTKRVWEEFTGKSASVGDMKALTVAKVAPIYRQRYWDTVKAGQMPPALAMCVFDFAVNAGPGRAAKLLQRLVGAAVDSQIGPGTLRAVELFVATHGVAEAVRRYQDARRTYYRSLGTFDVFGKGWLRRVDAVETAALKLI